MIGALLSPGLHLENFAGTRVAAANVANKPVVNALPEPFVLTNNSEGFSNLAVSSLKFAASSLNERLNGASGAVLGFLAPRKALKRASDAGHGWRECGV